jgi:hypothetical protein
MTVTVIIYSIVAFFGLWGCVASAGRILIAQDSQSRKKAAFSLIGAVVMVLISIAAIYIRFYDILSPLTVALGSLLLLILNYLVFPKYVNLSELVRDSR